jgi:hypothetical protein
VPNENWSGVYSSADGNTLLALARDGWPAKSTNGGATWTTLSTPYDFWQSVASSADGGRLLAASAGYLYLSTNAGTTWNQLTITTNASVSCSDALTVNGYSFYTNYAGPTIITTNSGIKSTNYPVAINYFSNSLPVLTIPNLFISADFLSLTDAMAFNLLGTVTNSDNTLSTNLVTAGLLGVNLQSIRMQGGNALGSLIGTNLLGTGALGTNVILTISGATNVLVILPNLGLTNVVLATLPLPFGAAGSFLDTNFISVLNTNVFVGTNSGIDVFVTNVLNVVITEVSPDWSAVASSADGSHLAAADNGGFIFISTNSGVTWSASSAARTNWSALAMSADGTQLTAVVNGGVIYSSSDSGASWAAANVPAANWRAVATSANGAALVAVVHGGVIYTGQSSGITSPPALQIQLANGNVVLSWAAGATNVVLQQNTNLAGVVWSDMPTTPLVTHGQNQVTLPLSAGPCLYRLKQP